jgi:hypothetical protein
MRRLQSILLLAVLGLAASARASDLQISDSTINYGTIKEGPPVIKKIVLTNGGTQTLAIANAAAS